MFKTQDQETAAATAAASSKPTTNIPDQVVHELPLPSNFLWGAATAAYQIEGGASQGGKGPSIWDAFSHRVPSLTSGDNGDVACDHYNRYISDVELLASYGVDEYRFSISWARLIPLGGREDPVNEAGVAFYDGLINALVERGIRPVATLYHWDLPLELETRYGGLLDTQEFRLDFERYARLCFERFGDRVRTWVTFNEPYISAVYGYIMGVNAPGFSDDDDDDVGDVDEIEKELQTQLRRTERAFRAAHSQIVAHAAAVRIYAREFRDRPPSTTTTTTKTTRGTSQEEDATEKFDGRYEKKGQISIVLNGDFYEPFDPSSPADVAAAQRRIEFYIAWFADPIYLGTDYPASMRDFFDPSSPSSSSFSSAIPGDSDGATVIIPQLPHFTPEEQELLHETAPLNGFYGMNHYTSQFARAQQQQHQHQDNNSSRQPLFRDYTGNVTELPTNSAGQEIGPLSGASWLRVTPTQFRKLMNWIWDRYPGLPIRVTENGCPCPPGESEELAAGSSVEETVVEDEFRVKYFGLYLDAVSRAIYEDGVQVEGYFAWSLLDNFEWGSGYGTRFGITHVDYETQVRTPKKSAAYLRESFDRRRGRSGGAAP